MNLQSTWKELSLKYPGIPATDFENIISITIHHRLKYGSAKPGLFGEILNYTFAVKEQNCGDLHVLFCMCCCPRRVTLFLTASSSPCPLKY